MEMYVSLTVSWCVSRQPVRAILGIAAAPARCDVSPLRVRFLPRPSAQFFNDEARRHRQIAEIARASSRVPAAAVRAPTSRAARGMSSWPTASRGLSGASPVPEDAAIPLMFLTSARASKKNPWCARVGRQIGDRGGAIRPTGDTHVQQEADGLAHKQSDKVFHERAIELQQTAPTLIGPPGRL